MADDPSSNPGIPVLTDAVDQQRENAEADIETLIAELQTTLAASTFSLAEQLLHAALAEMEATVYEQVTARLRRELPELIDSVLRRHLGADETD